VLSRAPFSFRVTIESPLENVVLLVGMDNNILARAVELVTREHVLSCFEQMLVFVTFWDGTRCLSVLLAKRPRILWII